MAARQMGWKLCVPAGVIGVGWFLYVRYRQAGHLHLVDWIIAGSALVMSLLIIRVCRPKPPAAGQDSEESPAVTSQPKWLLKIGLLPLLLLVVYGASPDLQNAAKTRGGRRQVTKALEDATKNAHTIRTRAGQADDTGWVPASSTAGGFFVYVPDCFNEVITTFRIGDRPAPVVAVGAATADLKFVAFAAYDGGSRRNLKARAGDAIKSLRRFTSAVVSREGLFENKFPLIEMEMKARKTRGLLRLIVTDETVYGLAVEGPELTDSVRTTAGRFFDSFALVASEPNELTSSGPTDGGEPNR